MPIILAGGAPCVGELDAEIARLTELVRDLTRIRDGVAPTAPELDAAPVLSDWRAATRLVDCLVGRPSGHPHLSGERDAVTSPLWLLDEDRGYARSESRFWRLGVPAGVRLDG
ncbi:DUF6634 family protein [Aureimonas ureilytica]|uniref:DUF6634 family protein n=1 Tax=Aureimonas ureilytica TaxID=401562 RepID=UPI0003630C39|nr:DUF6634 family protein [Aureimonas ureilytica]